MKHVKKNSLAALHELFDERLTADSVSEPFDGLDAASDAATAREFAARRGFDIIGVQRGGRCIGFARVDELRGGALGDYVRPLEEQAVVDASDGLRRTVGEVFSRTCVFVRHHGESVGIITLGDMNKAAVRMWLFSLVTTLEMQMLRILRHIPDADDFCGTNLSQNRLEKANGIRTSRAEVHADLDLLDCLQFCDKVELIRKFAKKRRADALNIGLDIDVTKLEHLRICEKIRNELAHAKDILIIHRKFSLIDFVWYVEELLALFEEVRSEPTSAG
jgi:hypothetical protein